jgi:uncharacterized protein YPO0396
MSTLFNNNNDENGFRLRHLEVFNWGTFNGKVYPLKTDNRTSLLTGANGSGKTTLIDALLTLLVPSNKRFYNQSSGAEIKKERDENSYFWGHYGKTFSELDEKSKTEQLRHKSDNPYSVLLACFQNSGTLHTITLVQVRWFNNGSLKKVFIVSPYQLNINEHFGAGHFDMKGEWKKKLLKQFAKTDIYDSFKEYAARFSELFGLKDKALSLFNQTVGIKVLGDLTHFIRNEMLEEADAEEQFRNLYTHYSDLLISHKKIQKDEKQIELLEPIIKNKKQLAELREVKETLEFIEGQMPFYIEKIEFTLLDEYIKHLEVEIERNKKDKETVSGELRQLEIEKEQLVAQKAALNVDNQILLLRKDIEAETEKRNKKSSLNSLYIKQAEELKLNTNIDERSFNENSKTLLDLQKKLTEEHQKLLEGKFSYNREIDTSREKIDSLQSKISSLLSRKNRMPEDLVSARKRLIDILETTEEEIPFAGELIRVKPGEQQWEDSIERLLHSFSMQLLVPEKYGKLANQFIHANDMQARVVYHKVDKRASASLVRRTSDINDLVNKIEIKESEYKKWLENYLLERFNYYCTDDLGIFYDCQKAITSNGLLRNVNRHEKDDRPGKWNKLKYRLGWDNKATILYLQQEKQNEEKEYSRLITELQKLIPQIDATDKKVQTVIQAIQVKVFDEINFKQHAEKITLLSRQVKELEESSDLYKTIVKQIEEVSEKILSAGKKRDSIIEKVSRLEIDCNQKNLRKLKISFEDLTEKGTGAIINFLKEEAIHTDNIKALEQLETLNIQIGIIFKNKLKVAVSNVSKMELKTTELIGAFVSPGEKITNEFPNWSGDILNMRPDLTALEDLEDLLKTIQTQRLVENKRRFREYMDKSMLDALTSYRAWLYNEEDKIKEMIEELNIPLKKITFNKNPDTYLQLECRVVRGENEINIFKEQLSKAIPDTLEFSTQKNEAYREEVFNKIKGLITELQKEEIRRRKVTDVRNWLTFGAREFSFSENRQLQYHDNTASYSGGQKAQFTYAILGAAIAHQFGIFQQGKQHKSLRFITVDEAFSKLDPEKSQFLMEFCAQLNLQILVVTPLDKINIAEPYINAVHFVEIKNKKNSVVYNLTMDEYYERKEEFKQMADNIE